MPVESQITGLLYLSEISDKLDSIENELRKFTEVIINREYYRTLLEVYNVENLEKGIRPDGTDIEKVPVGKQKSNKYERYTKYLKQKLGQETEVVSLRDTGDFHNSITVKIGFDAIYFYSRDKKAEDIESVWGDILGITEEQLFEFISIITPEYEKFVKKHFQNENF